MKGQQLIWARAPALLALSLVLTTVLTACQPVSSSLALSGWLHMVWSKAPDAASASKGFVLIDDQGRWHPLQLKEELTKPFGDPTILHRQRVKVLLSTKNTSRGAASVLSIRLRKSTQSAPQQANLTGWFHIVWGDGPPGSGISHTVFWLDDERGQSYQLELDERLTESFGGSLELNGRRVEVTVDLTTTDAGPIKVLSIRPED